MARWYGKVGYANTAETVAGVHEEQIIERSYYGDVHRNTRRLESSGNLNDNVNVAIEISIVSDAYAELNFHAMRYVEFMGARWKITNVQVERPRLTLTLGGVYNGEQA